MPRKISEHDIQRAVCIFLDKYKRPNVMYWHTPNGGRRGKLEATRMKQIGVMPGIPDLFIMEPSAPGYPGKLYGLELKTDTGRMSNAQYETHEALKKAGITSIQTVSSLSEAKEVLILWGLVDNSSKGQ